MGGSGVCKVGVGPVPPPGPEVAGAIGVDVGIGVDPPAPGVLVGERGVDGVPIVPLSMVAVASAVAVGRI